jgi:ABC-type polysaccharide/polyol phosphate transport system ATPase subunit
MIDKYSIVLNNVSKYFSIKNGLSMNKNFYALKNISIKVKKGECLGIVGKNGSGKSTLLKLIAGILQPSLGKIKVDGNLMPFLDLGTGFHEDLTGKENIYLYGSVLGLSNSEIRKNYNRIIDYADINKKFLNSKLKTYSSGMKARLAFAVAMIRNPDILLIDEILSVGDSDFQRKSFDKIQELKREGKTIIVVSHNVSLLSKICDRLLVLNEGKKYLLGDTEKIASTYADSLYDIDKKAYISSILLKKKEISTIKKKVNSLLMKENMFLNFFYSKKAERMQKELDVMYSEYLFLISDYKNFLFSYIYDCKNIKISRTILNDISHLFTLEISSSKNASQLYTEVYSKFSILLNDTYFLLERNDFFFSIISALKSLLYKTKNKFDEEFFLKQIDILAMHIRNAFPEIEKQILYLSLQKEKYMLSLNEEIDTQAASNKMPLKRIICEIKTLEKNKMKYNHFLAKLFNREQTAFGNSWGFGDAVIQDVVFLNSNDKVTNLFKTQDIFKARIRYYAKNRIEKPMFGVAIHKDNGVHLIGPNTTFSNFFIPYIQGEGHIDFVIDNLPFLDGTYDFSAAIYDYSGKIPYDHHDRAYQFRVINNTNEKYGMVKIPYRWSYSKT